MEFFMIILSGILVGFGVYLMPIISELGKNYIDPIPAALILTAIVIGFAVTCLLISIYIANYKLKRSDNVIELEDVEHMKGEKINA